MKSPLIFPALLGVSLCSGLWLIPNPGVAAEPPSDGKAVAGSENMEVIPGPLRSFLRMAGISQKVSADQVMPLVAHNVFMLGYEGSEHKGRRTEFLVLLMRYVDQARELQALAGKDGVLRAANCGEAEPLLKILGYRARPDCGKPGSYLQTADAQRAFLTIDSGFPLPDLEKDLQQGQPFTYAYSDTRVPVLVLERDKADKEHRDTLEAVFGDPDLARLYWALSRMDSETEGVLQEPRVIKRIAPFSVALNFYGSHIRIREGRVVVPGGASAEAGWKEIVGAGVNQPDEFIVRLLGKDRGWAAAYYDSLSRVSAAQQAHFTEARRLKRYYEALRGEKASQGAVTGVFRQDSELLRLLTQLTWEPNGEPHVPGNLQVWKASSWKTLDSKTNREWRRRSRNAENPEQLAEALFAVSRVQSEAGPLQAYLMACDLDSRRPREQQLSAETVSLLSKRFADYSAWYLVFSEFPELNDASIMSFLRTAAALGSIPDMTVRGNALGIFQANIGLWQILARQGQISDGELNQSWQRMIKPFGKVTTSGQVFDEGRDSLKELLRASMGKAEASQDQIVNLLAGPPQKTAEGQQMHEMLANRMRTVMEEQRLVSLDTLLTLGDGLHDVAAVKQSSNMLLPLAGELREFQMPQPIFKSSERSQWAAGIYNNQHTESQMRTDLSKTVKSPTSARQLLDARGQLTSFLRDTLVGLNYAYYEPPAAQVLHHNPLLVRSHDFSGATVSGLETVWQPSQVFGAGSPAGGGAHLVGSLADLPYVLSTVEQDFIAPENVQALIWREVVAGLLTDAIVPRWWGVSPNELHAVALYQKAGEELLEAASQNEELRNQVMGILSERMLPRTQGSTEQALREGRVQELLAEVTPADTFYLTAEYRKKYPGNAGSFGAAGKELEELCQRYAEEVNWQRLSRDFGVPHPVLGQNYGRELMNLAPLPTYMGYSSRLLAESWDSSNLYWARLADEKGYSPVMLNRLVPELTRRMIGKIFATDFEDWPALLRAVQETGEEFRQGKIATVAGGPAAKPQTN